MSDGEPIRENVSVADPQHVDRDLQIYKGAVRKTVQDPGPILYHIKQF